MRSKSKTKLFSENRERDCDEATVESTLLFGKIPLSTELVRIVWVYTKVWMFSVVWRSQQDIIPSIDGQADRRDRGRRV